MIQVNTCSTLFSIQYNNGVKAVVFSSNCKWYLLIYILLNLYHISLTTDTTTFFTNSSLNGTAISNKFGINLPIKFTKPNSC